MSHLLLYLLTVLQYSGLIALWILGAVVLMSFVFYASHASSVGHRLLNLLAFLCSPLACLATSLWYGLVLGKLGLALIFGVLIVPSILLFPLLVNLCLLPFYFARWIDRKLWPIRTFPQPMNDSNPPTNPTDKLVTEAEQLQKGSLANEILIRDTLLPAYAAASAKQGEEIPMDTMVEPFLSKAPTGGPGRMTWQEIWVFQTRPKTAVRITFTEDGKGGADYAIGMN